MSQDFIDLAQPRTVVIRAGAQQHTFNIPPIPEALWLRYFDGIISTAERDGKEIVQRTDASSAGVELVDSILAKQGMAQGTVPIAYRLALANVLTSAYAPDGAQTEEMEYCGENAVRLFAIWTGGEGDKMRRFKNLVHIFNVPSFEQYRRYRRDVSRSQVMGGSRKGTTVYRGAQRTLAALYDELIVAVMGYAANGVALDGREEIAQHMDTYHKVAAAAQLFTPEQLELDEEEES